MKYNLIKITFCLLYVNLYSQTKTFEFDSIYLNHEKTIEVQQMLNNPRERTKMSGFLYRFQALDINGIKFDTEKTKKIVVYNFWFTSCAPCISEIPMLNSLKEKYNNDVDFIAVTYNDSIEIKDFLIKHPFYFKHLFLNKKTIDALGVIAYPTTIIVKNNKILYSITGGNSHKESPYYYPMMHLMYKKLSEVIEENINKE